jgi:hypothetical protein
MIVEAADPDLRAIGELDIAVLLVGLPGDGRARSRRFP